MFINSLERGVMCHRAIGECKPPGVGDADAGSLALHYLGSEKEILDLFFGKSSLIRGPDKIWANQTEQRRCRELRPLPMKDVHRSTSPNYAHRAYSLNRRPAT
jgi:hypothetical protein